MLHPPPDLFTRNNPAADTSVAIIEHCRLAGRHDNGLLKRNHICISVARDAPRDRFLMIADFHTINMFFGRWLGYPGHVFDPHTRMLCSAQVSRHGDGIFLRVDTDDIVRLSSGLRDVQCKAVALAYRILRTPRMSADNAPVTIEHVALLKRDEPRKKIAYRDITDKTQALAIRTRRVRQARTPRNGAYPRFRIPANGKERLAEIVLIQPMEKVRLVFRAVPSAAEFEASVFFNDLRIVAGGYLVRTMFFRPRGKYAEFDVAVAEHVRIRCPAASVCGYHVGDDLLFVNVGEINFKERDTERRRDAFRRESVLLPRAF